MDGDSDVLCGCRMGPALVVDAKGLLLVSEVAHNSFS